MIRMKRPAERRSYFPVYGTLHPGLGTQIGGRERWRRESDADAFDLVEGDLIRAAVVEASGAGAFVVGHLLGDFEFAAVAEVFGDAGGAEAVSADSGVDASGAGPASGHEVDVGLAHRVWSEKAGRTPGSTKKVDVWVGPGTIRLAGVCGGSADSWRVLGSVNAHNMNDKVGDFKESMQHFT